MKARENIRRNLFASGVPKVKNPPSRKRNSSPDHKLNVSTESISSSHGNILYSPSIKRRPGRFYNKDQIPAALSPQKVISPRKGTEKGSPSTNQSKITHFFSSSPRKSFPFYGTRGGNRLSLSRKKSRLKTSVSTGGTNVNSESGVLSVDHHRGDANLNCPRSRSSSTESDINWDLVNSEVSRIETASQLSVIEETTTSPGSTSKTFAGTLRDHPKDHVIDLTVEGECESEKDHKSTSSSSHVLNDSQNSLLEPQAGGSPGKMNIERSKNSVNDSTSLYSPVLPPDRLPPSVVKVNTEQFISNPGMFCDPEKPLSGQKSELVKENIERSKNCMNESSSPLIIPSVAMSSPFKKTNYSCNEAVMKGTPQKAGIESTSAPLNSGSPRKNSVPNSPQPKVSGSFVNFLISSPASWFVLMQNDLFTDEELTVANNFNGLSKVEQDLYSRMFLRVNNWFRMNKLEYKFVSNLEYSLKELEDKGLVTSEFLSEDLPVLLELLQLNEIKEVCKQFRGHSRGTKKEMIQELLHFSKNQKTLAYVNVGSSMVDRLRLCIRNTLKSCVKLTERPREFFKKLVLITSYAHFVGDERQRLQDLVKRFYSIQAGVLYPPYLIQPSVVFHSKAQFDDYYEALSLIEKQLDASDSKDWSEGTKLAKIAKERLEHFLNNQNYKDLLKKLPDYLCRFTSGYVYSRAVGKGIVVLKKDKANDSCTVDCLHLLLSQDYFHRRLRGEWYDELALIYEKRFKDKIKALEALHSGLSDNQVDPIFKRALSLRANKLISGKKSGLTDVQKISLSRLIVSDLFKPPTVTISARLAPEGNTGLRQVYVRETEDGTLYSSVEDVASNYYKNEAPKRFSKVIHDEGRLVLNLALAVFWDEIYGVPEGLGADKSIYHSPMQTQPLDWCTRDFYNRRKNLIKEKIERIQLSGIHGVMEILSKLADGNTNVESVVSWNILQPLSQIQEFLECLGIHIFSRIAKHLLEDVRLYRSGFPDLTMWNPSTRECLIAEVKSPNDTLSHTQTYWMENLHNFGAHCEVCKIEFIQANSRKRKQDT